MRPDIHRLGGSYYGNFGHAPWLIYWDR